MKSAIQIYANLCVEAALQKRKKKLLLCDFFSILSGPRWWVTCVKRAFTVRGMRAQVLVLFCWSLSGVCSNLSPSHVWERHFVKVQRYFSAAWSFFSESHVPVPQVLSRVRACSHVLLHVLSFELLGLCKRVACVKRRTTFLRDGNLLKLLCFLLLQGMVAVLSGK